MRASPPRSFYTPEVFRLLKAYLYHSDSLGERKLCRRCFVLLSVVHGLIPTEMAIARPRAAQGACGKFEWEVDVLCPSFGPLDLESANSHRPKLRPQRLPRLFEHVFAYLGVVGELLKHLMAHVDSVDILLGLEVVEGELVPHLGGRLVLVLPRVLIVRRRILVRHLFFLDNAQKFPRL